MTALTLITVNDIAKMADAVAKSGLFGIKKPEEAMALMFIAQAEGSHPAIAIRDYHIIQGKPALKADAMLARFQSAGGKVQWDDITDTKVSATFSHPSGGSVKIDWTIERAKTAGLSGKENWRKFPRQMLRSRTISEGIRTVFPGVIVGVYTPEEVQDFEGKTIDSVSSEIKTSEEEKLTKTLSMVDEENPPKYTQEQKKEIIARINDELADIDSIEKIEPFKKKAIADMIEFEVSNYWVKKIEAAILEAEMTFKNESMDKGVVE